MKKLLAVGLLLAGTAYASNLTCPVDNFPMMWTGASRITSGVMLYEHRCVQGHISWSRDQ